MKTSYGHLSYCTNIHAGESWSEHFESLQKHIPAIKQKVSPNKPFGIGLRLSNVASLELYKKENLLAFQKWLSNYNCYVFTMNGFPYGSFHQTKVKEHVHTPDWTTADRVEYTIRLAEILSALLPQGMEGGISTSPLSYKHWHKEPKRLTSAFESATIHVLQVAEQLIEINKASGKLIHLDIEPEPDGLLETGTEFIEWYRQYLLFLGIPFIQQKFNCSKEEAGSLIKAHVQLCYDVCHFAVGYEDHTFIINWLKQENIRTGKIQISAAIKAKLPPVAEERTAVVKAFNNYNESTYLHQVIALQNAGSFLRYPDLPEALRDAYNPAVAEWRAHFHVPVFINDFGVLQSTQQDINEVIGIHCKQPFTAHLEIETYTWEVLPHALKLAVDESIVRELEWVIDLLEVQPRA
jgi:hypothetical protein